MTLILALVNSENAIIASDRRLVGPNGLQEDESNKAGYLVCRDARLGFAFTGLAECEGFQTKFWLPETLTKSAEHDGLMEPLIGRFRQHASEKFASLRGLSARDKRLTVILAGYSYADGTPRAYVWRISNFEDGLDGTELPEAQDEFVVHVWRDARLLGNAPADFVLSSGTVAGIPPESIQDLRSLVRACKPSVGLVGKAVAVIRETAAAPASHGVVGTQCSSIVIPSDRKKGAEAQYHSGHPTPDTYGPAYVNALGGKDGTFCTAGFELKALEGPGRTPALRIPRVGRNRLCPCGSGRKFKKCHGR